MFKRFCLNCKKSKKERTYDKAVEILEESTNAIDIVKQLRFFQLACTELLTPDKKEELK